MYLEKSTYINKICLLITKFEIRFNCRIFIIAAFLLVCYNSLSQRYDCSAKNGRLEIAATNCQKFQYQTNTTPIRLSWYINHKLVKTVASQYQKNYSSFIKDTIVLGNNLRYYSPYLFNQYDSAWLYFSISRLYWKNQHLVHPYFITPRDSVFSSYPNFPDMIENQFFTNLVNDFQKINYHSINDPIRPIANTYFDWTNSKPGIGDTVIRIPRQMIANKNLLYILDLNYETPPLVNDTIKVKHQPKIAIYDYQQRKYIGQLPHMRSNYPPRHATPCTRDTCPFIRHLRYNNFDILGNRLYLNYSYNMHDSLAVFDLDSNKWIHTMALPVDSFIYHDSVYIDATFKLYFTQYGPVTGKSNIRLDRSGNIFVAEYKGNIYRISSDFKRIDTIFHLRDSSKLGFYYPHFTTKKFEIDGWDNMILPDVKTKNIKRYDNRESRFSVIIDSLYLGCVNLFPDKPTEKLYVPYNLQADCNGNLYVEYDHILDTNDNTSDKTCDSKYFLRFEAFIDDSFDASLGVNDSLKVVAYFYDGDSITESYYYPYHLVNQIDSSVCNTFKFKNKTHSNSIKLYDTIQGISCIDTLVVFNFKVYKDTIIKFNHYSCKPYQWLDSVYTQSGKYQKIMKTVHQCDSIAELDLSIGLNNNLKIDNGINYTALQDNVSYQWYRCNPWRRITNETKKTFTTKTRGSYAVVLDDGKGCRDTSDCIALYSSQLSNVSGQQAWSVFPNPFNDALIIDLVKDYKEVSVKIYDIAGRIVQTEAEKNTSKLNIQNSKLTKGIYYIQIETESQNQFFNIRKE